jgi:hypothetical protein
MKRMNVNVSIYGPLAGLLGGKHIAQADMELDEGASIADLLECLKIDAGRRGYLFVNSVLCEVPGISTGRGETLRDGDHVGIFSREHMWPYQYRDGIKMSASLKELLKEHGPMRHAYDK